jgi:hypothetical protein
MRSATEKGWELINDLANPDTLCKLVPRLMGYNEVYRDIAEMQELDAAHVGRFTKSTGMWAGGAGQRVGWIPIELYVVIERLSPGFFSNKKNRDRFLKENPQFDLRRKVR